VINLANAETFILFSSRADEPFPGRHLKTTHAVLHLALLQLELPLAESQLALPELEVRRAGGVVRACAGQTGRGVVGGVMGIVREASRNVLRGVVRASARDSAGSVVRSAAGDGAACGVRTSESASSGRTVTVARGGETAVV
jgi:hypothetical protein